MPKDDTVFIKSIRPLKVASKISNFRSFLGNRKFLAFNWEPQVHACHRLVPLFLISLLEWYAKLTKPRILTLNNFKKAGVPFWYWITHNLSYSIVTVKRNSKHKLLALDWAAHHQPMHPLHACKIISNPWPLPMPYKCALFQGSLLLWNTGVMGDRYPRSSGLRISLAKFSLKVLKAI